MNTDCCSDHQFVGKYLGNCLKRAMFQSEVSTETDRIADKEGYYGTEPIMVINIISPENDVVDFSSILGQDYKKWTKNAILDWGDGSYVNVLGNEWHTNNRERLQHKYKESNRPYKITIRGGVLARLQFRNLCNSGQHNFYRAA